MPAGGLVNGPSLGTVAFIGIGLIGGSLALALRQAGLAERIVARDQSPAALAEALALGVIDEALPDDEALRDADLIILATPVAALFDICARLARLPLKADVVISDVGSTKRSVLAAFRQAYGRVPANYVPAHPIAGREKSGVAHADGRLFVNHRVILTTLPETDHRALGLISRLWHSTGALLSYMDVDSHDEILGATSHLPHLLAYVLVDMLASDLQHEQIFSYAAGGFRDFTRVASSHPTMWRDIALNNSDVLIQLLETYRQRLGDLQQLLRTGRGDELEALFRRAKTARDQHYSQE